VLRSDHTHPGRRVAGYAQTPGEHGQTAHIRRLPMEAHQTPTGRLMGAARVPMGIEIGHARKPRTTSGKAPRREGHQGRLLNS